MDHLCLNPPLFVAPGGHKPPWRTPGPRGPGAPEWRTHRLAPRPTKRATKTAIFNSRPTPSQSAYMERSRVVCRAGPLSGERACRRVSPMLLPRGSDPAAVAIPLRALRSFCVPGRQAARGRASIAHVAPTRETHAAAAHPCATRRKGHPRLPMRRVPPRVSPVGNRIVPHCFSVARERTVAQGGIRARELQATVAHPRATGPKDQPPLRTPSEDPGGRSRAPSRRGAKRVSPMLLPGPKRGKGRSVAHSVPTRARSGQVGLNPRSATGP